VQPETWRKKPEQMRIESTPNQLRCAAQSSHETVAVWGTQNGNRHKSVARYITRRLTGRQQVPSPSKTSATLVSPWFEPGPDSVLRDSLHKRAIGSHLKSLPMRRWGATLPHCSNRAQAQSGETEMQRLGPPGVRRGTKTVHEFADGVRITALCVRAWSDRLRLRSGGPISRGAGVISR